MDSLTHLGDYAFELADRIREEHGADAAVGDIILICEVLLPDGSTRTETLSSESRRYVATAIINRALAILEHGEDTELDALLGPVDDED